MKRRFISAFAVLLASTSAFAADLYQPEPEPVIADEPIEVSEASGWYLRGDVGYSWNKLRGARFIQGSVNGIGGEETSFDRADLRDAFTIGGGVGYQVNSYLRGDVTLDYMFRSRFNGSTTGGGADFGACVTSCTSRDVASLTAVSLLVNAYVDLHKFGPLTPYVGVGGGGAYVKWKNLTNTSINDNNPEDSDPPVTHDGKGKVRPAFALMLGTSIDMTCNLKADLGYRYRRIVGGKMFGYAENGGPGRDRGLTQHEGRLGLRYVFNGCAEQAYMPPADIPLQPAVYK